MRVHAAAHQSKWCKSSVSADTFPNLFHAVFWLIHTEGFTPCRFHRDVCLCQGVLNNSQLLFQVFLWALTDYDCTFVGWFFYLDLYLFLKQSIPCSASKEHPGWPKVNLSCSLLNWLPRTELDAWKAGIKLTCSVPDPFHLALLTSWYILSCIYPAVKDFSSVPVFLYFSTLSAVLF